MSKFDHLVCSRIVVALSLASLRGMATSSLLLACTTAHMESGTETGNPPVIDVQKVALVVASQGVRVVGQPGAVIPGGVTVEATVVGTGEVVSRASNSDGSFDIPLSASADAVVDVRAAASGARSSVVYVTRSGASVGGESASLSCMQRTNLASQAAGNLANSADTSCRTASDCAEVSTQTVCTDSCSDSLVAASAVASVQAGIATINQDLCGSFASEGCTVIALPCAPPPTGPVACVAGQCTRLSESASECPSCVGQTVAWGPSGGETTNTIYNCDSFARTTMSGPGCEGAVAHCGGSGKATVEELLVALEDPEIEIALANHGTLVGPPAPGGGSTVVKVGTRSLLIADCSTGPNCSAIPEGIQRLSDLLWRLASETECTPLVCPPNSIYIADTCVRCGDAGVCAAVAPRCAVVCSGDDACSGMAGTVCSTRGVCEITECN